jgi:hypothetical protein
LGDKANETASRNVLTRACGRLRCGTGWCGRNSSTFERKRRKVRAAGILVEIYWLSDKSVASIFKDEDWGWNFLWNIHRS